jgi:threonine/homoserine/homoserine lactone efflux protein
MAETTGSLLTELIPLALVIAVSPLSIIPAVLVLHSPWPRPAGSGYLLGWMVSLAVLTAIFVAVSGLLGSIDKAPRWASWLRIVVGAALIVFGIFRWLTRHRSAHSPAWMRQLTAASPAKAVGIAALLAAVNPKVMFVCAAAGLTIGTAGLSAGQTWAPVVYFVAVAASSVALPVVAYLLSGERLDGPLARVKDWMEKHNAAIVAVILLVIGLVVLYKGVRAL